MADRLTSSSSCARCTRRSVPRYTVSPCTGPRTPDTPLRSASVLRARGARRTGRDAPPNAQSRRSVSSSLSLHSSLISILYPAHRVEHIFEGQFCQSPCFFQLPTRRPHDPPLPLATPFHPLLPHPREPLLRPLPPPVLGSRSSTSRNVRGLVQMSERGLRGNRLASQRGNGRVVLGGVERERQGHREEQV